MSTTKVDRTQSATVALDRGDWQQVHDAIVDAPGFGPAAKRIRELLGSSDDRLLLTAITGGLLDAAEVVGGDVGSNVLTQVLFPEVW